MIGGFLGVVMPLNARLGLFTIAAVLVIWLFVVLRALAISRRTARTDPRTT